MLSQKCAKQEEVDLSGGVGGMVNKVRKVLEELNYLSWQFPFLKVSLTKSNLSIWKETDEEGYDDEDHENVDQNDGIIEH